MYSVHEKQKNSKVHVHQIYREHEKKMAQYNNVHVSRNVNYSDKYQVQD